MTEHELIDYGVSVGWLTPEKAEQLKKEFTKIVRCKDCIHFNADNIPEEGCGYCELLSRTYESEHFCSDGERKEG